MEAIQSVALRARVEGFLEKVAFREGSDVNENDLLYMIEQAPYQARFKRSQAKVSRIPGGIEAGQTVSEAAAEPSNRAVFPPRILTVR